jgi:hypothetical protein
MREFAFPQHRDAHRSGRERYTCDNSDDGCGDGPFARSCTAIIMRVGGERRRRRRRREREKEKKERERERKEGRKRSKKVILLYRESERKTERK